MARFTALDWIWAGAFLLLMVGGAFLFQRLGHRSESDFFLPGCGLPWWLPAASVFSTHTATDTPMWMAGVVYAHASSRATSGTISPWHPGAGDQCFIFVDEILIE